MSDDFPSVERGGSGGRSRPPKARKARRSSGRKRSTKKSTSADRKALREAADDIVGDTSDAPKKEKTYLDKIADKVTGDIMKKQRGGRRKASAAQRRQGAEKANDLAATLMGIGNTPIGQLAKKGGALAVGGTVALALLAGVGSYYGTTYIIDRLAAAKEARTPQAVRFEAAMAYRQARIEAARKLGRELSESEQKFLGSQFKQKLATIGG